MRFALGVLALGIGTAFGGCRCAALPGEEVLAKTSGPPSAELVWVHGFHGGGRFGGVTDSGELRIGALRLTVCGSPKRGAIEVDDAGERVFVQCDDSAWQVVWIGKTKQLFELGEAVMKGDAVDHAASPRLPDAADRAALFDLGISSTYLHDLALELRAIGASDAIGPLLVKIANADYSAGNDPWIEAVRTLDEGGRAKFLSLLCGRLTDTTPDRELVRVLRTCPTVTPNEADALARIVEGKTAREPAPLGLWLDLWTLFGLSLADPDRAGAAACTRLKDPKLYPLGRTVAISTLALSKAPCDAKLPLPCDVMCSGRACALSDYAEPFAKFKASLATELPRADVPPTFEHAELFATLSRGELPTNATFPALRPSYKLANGGPPCDAVTTRGEPCTCWFPDGKLEKAACELGTSGNGFQHDRCAVTFDDAAKTRSVTHACGTLVTGYHCKTDADCCADLVCVESSPTWKACGAPR